MNEASNLRIPLALGLTNYDLPIDASASKGTFSARSPALPLPSAINIQAEGLTHDNPGPTTPMAADLL
ncbi:MAG TPA: hypothetical protein PKH32_04425 [Verrucomicrobiota bacterium]|nr:hypothetical protein [Verrucomicrobiota bacterium]